MKKSARMAAVVLAAGSGKRMGGNVKKQYLLLQGKPILSYSLKIFQDSEIDEIILVTGKDEIDYCQKEIVEKYGITKVTRIVEGGKERYHSVAKGLLAVSPDCDYVFIHDGARPFLTEEILKRGKKAVMESLACVVGMPAKDTIKLSNANGYVSQTPDRSLVWTIQTPQIFSYAIIMEAYQKLIAGENELLEQGIHITDDAMVVETFQSCPIRLVEGSYENIKITTPEDLDIAEAFLKKLENKLP